MRDDAAHARWQVAAAHVEDAVRGRTSAHHTNPQLQVRTAALREASSPGWSNPFQ